MSYGSALVIIKNSNNKYFVVSRNKIKQIKQERKQKKTKKVFSHLKTNGTNRKFIIFLKLKEKKN